MWQGCSRGLAGVIGAALVLLVGRAACAESGGVASAGDARLAVRQDAACDVEGGGQPVTIGSYLIVQRSQPLVDPRVFLNGHLLTGAELDACPVRDGRFTYRFHLSLAREDRPAWGSAFDAGAVTLAIAQKDGQPAIESPTLPIVKWVGWRKYVAWLVPLTMLALLGALAFGSSLLRDPGALPVRQRTFSLARTQIALWTMLVGTAAAWHYLATRTLSEIPDGIAALMGLSTFTLGAATVIDASKRGAGATATQGAVPSSAVAPAQQPLASEGFLLDILTDRNGVSMHRLQMVVWTVLMAGVFVHTVVTRLFMPDFSNAYLAIAGISSAGYAFLKIPEQQV